MTVTVKHNFTASHGEDPDPSLVAQNAWNDAHAVTVDPGLVGRSPEGGAGPAQTIAVGSGLVLTGGVLTATGGGGAGVTNISTAGGIAGGPISSTGTIVLADVPAASIKGRTAGSVGPPADLTGAQATALLDPFTSSAKGLVPASGGGTTNFLRADGAFVPPPGGSGGGGSLTNLDTGVGLTGGPITISGTVSMANVPSMTVKGRVAAGAGAPTDLFSPDITSLISPFTSSTKGAVPASGGGTTNFLRADGAFAAPPTGGGGGGGGGGGAGNASTMWSFGIITDAMSAIILDNIDSLQIAGFDSVGDGGAGSYARVNAPIIPYVDPPIPPIPPGFSTGIPNLVFANTRAGLDASQPWMTTQPIIAECLTVLLIMDLSNSSGPFYKTPPSTFSDSAGNVYTLVDHAPNPQYSGGAPPGYETCIYYNANPVAAPVGTSFDSIRTGATCLSVFCFGGYKNAVLGPHANQSNASSTGGVSLTLSGLDNTKTQLVFGIVSAGGNANFPSSGAVFTEPGGWSHLSPAISFNDPQAAIIKSSVSSVTYNPTWSGSVPTAVVMASFTSATNTMTALDPAYWQLQPSWPVHAAQYGIVDGVMDQEGAYKAFGAWLASIAPPSNTSAIVPGVAPPGGASSIMSGTYDTATGFISLTLSQTVLGFGANVACILDLLTGTGTNLAQLNGTWMAGTVSGTAVALFGPTGKGSITITGGNLIYSGCSISIANPAVVTIAQPRFVQNVTSPNPHGFQAGQTISFSTTGALPTGIVAGQRYYIQPGTLLSPTGPGTGYTFQISATPLFGGSGQHPLTKGSPVVTSGSQSGVHTYTIYGEEWAEVVFDPGLYYSNNNQWISGYGLRKMRFLGYGARLQTLIDVGAGNTNLNDGLVGNLQYSTQFASTTSNAGFNQKTITLVGSPTQVDNIDVNSWVQLSCNEVFGANSANWDTYTFEYAQVRAKDRSAGTLTFYDPIRYNYRSTFPSFEIIGSGSPGPIMGPATVLALNPIWGQEIEFCGFCFNGISEEDWTNLLSIRLYECTIDGWAFKSGPTFSGNKKLMLEKCTIRNSIMEFDKNIDHIEWKDCIFEWSATITCSSPSANMCIFDKCTIAGGLSGSPKVLIIRDTLMTGNWAIGPVYGQTERILLQSSHIQQIISNNQEGQALPVGQAGYTFVGGTLLVAPGSAQWHNPSAHLSSANPIPWGVPGAKVIIYSPVQTTGAALGFGPTPTVFSSQSISPMTSFNILDTYVDGSGNFCVDTDMAALPTSNVTFTGTMSGTALTVTAGTISPADAVILKGMTVAATAGGTLPAGTTVAADIGIPNATTDQHGAYTLNHSPASGAPTSFTASSPMTYLPHPCPRMTVVNCTGGSFVADQVGAPPDIPMFSYFNRAFSVGSFPAANLPKFRIQLFGNLNASDKVWRINVSKVYSGATGTFTLALYLFGWKTSGANLYPTYAKLTINLKQAGPRTIVGPGGTQLLQSGDALVDCTGSTITSVGFWLAGGHTFNFTNALNGADTLATLPRFTMTAQTDQNIDSAALIVNPTTPGSPGSGFGVDQLADTVMGAIL